MTSKTCHEYIRKNNSNKNYLLNKMDICELTCKKKKLILEIKQK